MQRKNIMGRVGGGRSQKVPASQHSGSQAHHTSPEEKPGSKKGITTFKVDVADGTQDGSKLIIITLETIRWREETWRCPEGV